MKKWLSALFVASIISGFSMSTSAQTFKDVSPSASYYSAVELLGDLGAINTATDKFNPNGTVTRGQAAKILAVTLKLDTKNVTNPNFKDVPKSSGFYPYVAALQNAGIINGKTKDRFGVNDSLTRGQMAKILVRGFGLPEFELEGIFEAEPAVAIGKETRKYVSPLYFYGITTGVSENQYGAGNPLKRSQLALFVERTYEVYDDIKNDEYISVYSDPYQYPESSLFDVADVVAVGYDGGFLLQPYKAGQTAIYYGDKTLLVTVDRNLQISYKEVSTVPAELKPSVAEYRYYDFAVAAATSYNLNGQKLEDLTPDEGLASLSFTSRSLGQYMRLEIILENGDLFEYYITAQLDETGRYYLTQLYEVKDSISFFYLDEGDVIDVPANSGLSFKVGDDTITFEATKTGKFEVGFGMDVRGIEVIEVAGELAIREYELQ